MAALKVREESLSTSFFLLKYFIMDLQKNLLRGWIFSKKMLKNIKVLLEIKENCFYDYLFTCISVTFW